MKSEADLISSIIINELNLSHKQLLLDNHHAKLQCLNKKPALKMMYQQENL